MRTEKLQALSVVETDDASEYYCVGRFGITSIEWGRVGAGSCGWVDTVQVYKDGELFSEHPFINCIGVYFAQGDDDGA